MGRGMGGEVCNHLVEEAKWGVEIDGRIESVPGNREKICVCIEVVMEPGAKEGELGIEGRCHGINLWWGQVLGMNEIQEV